MKVYVLMIVRPDGGGHIGGVFRDYNEAMEVGKGYKYEFHVYECRVR